MFCLRASTDPAWAEEAARDLDAVLVDHAHCEMKAATNALSLVVRHPDDLGLVRALTELAREELDHFQRVVALLDCRGLPLGPPPVDAYAGELRRAMGALPSNVIPPVVDRLLVSALIEARSCERFKLLLGALPKETAVELRAFYEELFACEARHYRVYVELARRALGGAGASDLPSASGLGNGVLEGDVDAAVNARLSLLAEAEGKIVRSLAARDVRASMHG